MRTFAVVVATVASLSLTNTTANAITPKQKPLQLCLRLADGKLFSKKKCKAGVDVAVDAQTFAGFVPTVQGPTGPQGPQGEQGPVGSTGANGISGLQVYTQQTTLQMNSTQFLTFSANCQGGKKVLGGGCSQSTTAIQLQNTKPNATGDGWQCNFYNSFPNPLTPTITVYAICANAF